MQFEKSCLEFQVNALQEVRILLKSWGRVMARFQELGERAQRLTDYHLVNVCLEDRMRPAEVVVLQFLAPQRLLDMLVADLKSQDLECLVEVLVPGLLAKGRLQRRLYAHPAATK